MINKDVFLLEQAYTTILEKASKKKRPDEDGDGIPDYADKHPGKDDHAVKGKGKKLSKEENKERFLKMVKGKQSKNKKTTEGLNFKELFKEIITEAYTEDQIKDCEKVIKMMASGRFKNVPKDMMNKVKSCSMFSITTDKDGKHTVIIKDGAVKKIEEVYPKLKGKFMSAKDCRKDVARCRKEKTAKS